MIIKRVAAVVFAALLALPAAAQEMLPADSAALANHIVTEAELARVELVLARMDSVLMRDPRAFTELQPGDASSSSLGEAGRLLEAHPALGTELARAGMTGREFLVIFGSLFIAALGVEFRDDGSSAAPPAGMLANMQLVEAQKARMERLFAMWNRVLPD